MADAGDLRPQVVEGSFDDIDALAAAALEWDQEYEQLGRGHFRGHLTQLLLGQVQLNREQWQTGVLQRGAAPQGTWVFGLPLRAEGQLHIRRRPTRRGELLAATSRDDVGFVAEGATDLIIVVLPDQRINRWMQVRRGVKNLDPDLPPRRWAVSDAEMLLRSRRLSRLLDEVLGNPDLELSNQLLTHVEEKISETILDMIPSAETIEALHSRARIGRELLRVLYDRLDDPPTVTELCDEIGTRERTLHLSCVEAFGRPPAQLLLELRLNAARRALRNPDEGMTVTRAASRYGFMHLGRFSSMYARQFAELPSATLAISLGVN